VLLTVLLTLVKVQNVLGQDGGDCTVDTDCGEKDPCCSRFGFCGEDAGYCYPIEGCILRGVEIEGGDLSAADGGGGVNVDRGQLDGCAYICEENSLCGWYTYDKSSNLCYLKGSRGFLSNKTQTATIISGSTQSSGCTFNPRVEGSPAAARPGGRRRRRRCRFPFRRYGNRCVHYCRLNRRWGVNQRNNRRNYFNSKLLCNRFGSKLPYSLEGSAPTEDYGNDWHWLGFPPKEDQCLAVRPSRYLEGAAYFPCAYKFNIACENVQASQASNVDKEIIDDIDGDIDLLDNEVERQPKLVLPKIQIVTNISRFNYKFEKQVCSQGLNNCGGRWMPNYGSTSRYGGCGLNSCDRTFSGYNGVGYSYGGTGYSTYYNNNPFYNMRGYNFNSNGGCNSCGGGGYGYNRGFGGGCNNNNCGGGRGYNNYDYDYYNYGGRGRGRDYGNYDYYDYNYNDYDYGVGRRGIGGGRRRGIVNVGGTSGGTDSRRRGGATGQRPGDLKEAPQENPKEKYNPYLELLLGKK